MQLEVPKDQYQKVLDGFRRKIEKGKVPGVTDPNEAPNIVRKGRLTYQQAVNLTKPGTIESLSYDAFTGAVTCSCALGITFVVTVFLTWRKTGDIKLYRKLDYPEYIKQSPKLHDFCEKIRDNILM